MAITFKGNKVIFTGKDYRLLRNEAKVLKLSIQDTVTGMLWEYIMRKARENANAIHRKRP